MTGCAGKIAYLSQYLAQNAATLHRFVHPECTDIQVYRCAACPTGQPGVDDVWHIGHQHYAAGRKCKTEPPVRPFRPYRPKKPRGAA